MKKGGNPKGKNKQRKMLQIIPARNSFHMTHCIVSAPETKKRLAENRERLPVQERKTPQPAKLPRGITDDSGGKSKEMEEKKKKCGREEKQAKHECFT